MAEVVDRLDLPSSGVVADIGCGNGRYLAELARRGFQGRPVGIDLSVGMLAAARSRAATAGLAAAGVSALSLGDGVVGLTFAMHTLYHVPDPAAAVRGLHPVHVRDPERPRPRPEAVVRDITARIFPNGDAGSFTVTTHAGCLICS